uniref:Replication initiation protein n=1 Tax=Polaromonas sp. H1N TaxID=1840283 RepID=A0A2S1FIJ2_9BURK|nr:plasmid replication initiator TrfA [Polaromonas sp. H1N]AWD72179.1 replication initiation protein [Polaromonas sp. H1N]
MAIKDSEEWLKARVEKAKQALALQAASQEAAPAQLPLWPDAVRAVPNALLRGALFSISNVREVVKKRTLLASVKGIEVRFKGERLNQTDLDTWETIIHLARAQKLGSKVQFSAHSMLTMLGRHHGREQHEQLKEDISRLTGAVVEITIKETAQAFGGALVQSYYRDEVEQVYVIEVSPQLLKLYQAGNTYIDWSERQQLGNANLAKWLHGFYSSHAVQLPYKVATIRDLCGAKATQRLGDFRKLLRTALDLLVTRETSITGWSIDENDCVVVTRRPSNSQRNHLEKR